MNEGDALQFDRAEFVSPEARACVACKGAITDEYYAINGNTLCATCHPAVVASLRTGGSFWAALGLGLGGALVGAALYYGVSALTGYNLALVAIVVGILVGKGVARGARGRGGAGYQALAIGLTYFSVALTYVPEIVQAWNNHPPDGSLQRLIAIPLYAGLMVASPIVAGFASPLSLVITAFALYEAWKLNKRPQLVISGPHSLRPAAPSPVAAPANGDAASNG